MELCPSSLISRISMSQSLWKVARYLRNTRVVVECLCSLMQQNIRTHADNITVSMLDSNNNVSGDVLEEDAQKASNELRDWLESHTDPNRNPWTEWDDDSWSAGSDGETDSCLRIDPTAGREAEEDCVEIGRAHV